MRFLITLSIFELDSLRNSAKIDGMVAVRLNKTTRQPSQPPFWKSNEWADYVKHTVQGYRRRSISRALNDHDWDDIAQTCMIHIWKKRGQYRRDWPLKPWLKVVTLRQVQNQIRNRLAYSVKNRASRFKAYFRRPYSLVTKTVYVDSLREEVRYEPDMIDPRTIPPPISIEDSGELTLRERNVLKRHMLDGNTMDVVRRDFRSSLGLSMKAKRGVRKAMQKEYVRVLAVRKRLQERYIAALNS